MRIYVGNLPFGTDDQELSKLFEAYGAVDSAKVITDRDTGRSRGFGFVEMLNETEAKAAIEGLTDFQHDGRNLTVNEARPRENRGGGNRGGDRGGGGGNRW